MAEAAAVEKTTETDTATTTVDTKTADVTTATTVAAADAKTSDATTTTAVDTSIAQTKGIWPEDWQKRMAGEDDKELKQIGRYASPVDIWKKARSLEARLSSGELKPILPKDPKPEELAQWRKDNGIPEKATDYKLDGLTIPEGDKDIITGILEKSHANNLTPEQAKAGVALYYDIEKSNIDKRLAKDEEQRVSTLDALNAEWGGQFRRNVNLVEGLLAKFPESVRAVMKSARLPDGTAAFNHPDILRGFTALALELNPAGVVVPASGGDVNKVALDEYKDLQKFMREKRTDYNKDQAKQDRMIQLIDHLTKENLIDGNGNEIRKAA